MKNNMISVLFLILFLNNISFASIIEIDKDMQVFIHKTYGGDSLERIKYLNKFVDDIDLNISQIEKLNLVNNFFNKFTYIRDKNHWKKDNYWATLIEFVATGAGDSEDFAMAKYFILTKIGFDTTQFELLYDLNRYEFTKIDDPEHIVLSYKYSNTSKIIILDCVSKKLKVMDNSSKYRQLEKSKSFIENHLNHMLDLK